MAKTIYVDKDGQVIPSKYLPQLDKDKHEAALRIHKQALKISQQLTEFKADVFKTADALYDRMLAEKQIKLRDNSRGGYSIITTDGSVKIEVTVSETIAFDERIETAQKLINEYLEDKTTGGDQELLMLVNQAFKKAKGHLDTRRIVGLMKLDIKSSKWAQAMELIKESIKTTNSKRYVRVWARQENGDYKAVKLDFASI